MSTIHDPKKLPVPLPAGPVGIVVRGEASERPAPRAVAFIWGMEVLPAPSLPFGRWKPGILSAA